MSEKKKLPTIITPVGTLSYPWLGKPDSKFAADKPVYKTGLILDPNVPEVATLIQKLDQLADEAVAKFKKEAKTQVAAKAIQRAVPYVLEADAEGNETGNVVVRFKMNAHFSDEKTKKTVELRPNVFNAKNEKIDATKVSIGGGSLAQVAFQALPYYNASSKAAGVSLRMQGVRVLKVVSYGGVDGAALFGAAAEGYDDETDGNSGGFGTSDAGAAEEGAEEF